MGRLRIDITADGITAELVVAAGPPASAVDVQAALAAASVNHGLDLDAIAAASSRLQDPQHQGRTVVARGSAARPGNDGRLELTWPLGLQPGTEAGDGHVDFRERQFLHPVSAGTVCARIVEPEAGAPGRSVRGAVLPAKAGRPVAVRPGPGLQLAGDRLIAVRGGTLVGNGTAIDVVPLFQHGADVDYRSGNLHTDGALVVRGDVREGFAATATEAVHVLGAVLDSSVHGGGSVRIEQGVLGPTSLVVAGTDLWCRHATGATLQAGRLLTFGDGASHCRAAATDIVATTGRGAVFGGELRARQRVAVRSAGRDPGAPTTLAVADLTTANAELVRNTGRDQKLAERARHKARTLGSSGGKSLRQATRLGDAAQQERLQLRLQQRELLRTACIEVLDQLHLGVRLGFGEHNHTVTEVRQHVRLRWDVDADRLVEERLP